MWWCGGGGGGRAAVIRLLRLIGETQRRGEKKEKRGKERFIN